MHFTQKYYYHCQTHHEDSKVGEMITSASDNSIRTSGIEGATFCTPVVDGEIPCHTHFRTSSHVLHVKIRNILS